MSETKHTPGPWHTGGKGDSIIYADCLGYTVANATTYHKHIDGDTMKANAHLIAAAPDLLEALKGLELSMPSYKSLNSCSRCASSRVRNAFSRVLVTIPRDTPVNGFAAISSASTAA